MLADFDLLTPQSLPDALRLLAGAPGATPLAGGTNLVVNLRAGRDCPPVLVDVSHLPELRGVRLVGGANGAGGEIVVGAGTTITTLLDDPLIARYAPLLREAASVFANPLVRNRATVGGNLADASPAADTAPALLALDASVMLVSAAGARCLPLADFFLGPRQTRLQPGELIASVRWPVPPERSAGGFAKIGLRKADAIAVLSAAVMVEAKPDGADGVPVCHTARIALGAVAPRPMRVPSAEAALIGRPLAPSVIANAARMAAAAAMPIDDVRSSARYRRHTVEVIVRRLLERAAADITRMGAVIPSERTE
jgi:CO/xanthine dehydrogenase FAD-binding subunit